MEPIEFTNLKDMQSADNEIQWDVDLDKDKNDDVVLDNNDKDDKPLAPIQDTKTNQLDSDDGIVPFVQTQNEKQKQDFHNYQLYEGNNEQISIETSENNRFQARNGEGLATNIQQDVNVQNDPTTLSSQQKQRLGFDDFPSYGSNSTRSHKDKEFPQMPSSNNGLGKNQGYPISTIQQNQQYPSIDSYNFDQNQQGNDYNKIIIDNEEDYQHGQQQEKPQSNDYNNKDFEYGVDLPDFSPYNPEYKQPKYLSNEYNDLMENDQLYLLNNYDDNNPDFLSKQPIPYIGDKINLKSREDVIKKVIFLL